MIDFEADKKPLVFLLDQIEQREIALPDFQRSFVWDPPETRELVVSILSSFPAGSLLLHRGGDQVFAPRQFEEAPALSGSPSYLVLDGQQRLTSLFQAFSGRGTHRFFLNIADLLNAPDDLDEAVEVYPLARAARWADVKAQAEDMMMPLDRFRTFDDWKDEVVDLRDNMAPDGQKLRPLLNRIGQKVVKNLDLYHFPVTTLGPSVTSEAICTIFETLNRTGRKLSVFELLTARAYAGGHKLREFWRQSLEQYPVLQDFGVDPVQVLQIIAIREHGSPKRGRVLRLEPSRIVAGWEAAVLGLAQTLDMLRAECGVLTAKWLPYTTMLVTLGAVWPVVREARGPASGERRAKLQRWFWCATFSGRYENIANTRTEQDVPVLEEWLRGGPIPEVVDHFHYDSSRWREVTARQRAVYKASIALALRQHPLDFHTGQPLDKDVIEAEHVDDHHVFPRKYLEEAGADDHLDTVLNHTLIDRTTNIRIGKKPPSEYLKEIEDERGSRALDDILLSHGFVPDRDGPLRNNDYDAFLEQREQYLTGELTRVTEGSHAAAPVSAPRR